MAKHYSKLRQCFKCFKVETFNNVEFYFKNKIIELRYDEICTECYPKEAQKIISKRVKKNKNSFGVFADEIHCPYNPQY